MDNALEAMLKHAFGAYRMITGYSAVKKAFVSE
jgi:hypothetical protein